MSSNESQDAGTQYGSGNEGSFVPPSSQAVASGETVASISTENALPSSSDQLSGAGSAIQNLQGPFSSPARGRGSYRGRFRGTAADPYQFFDLHARGGRGRFSSQRAPITHWDLYVNQNYSYN